MVVQLPNLRGPIGSLTIPGSSNVLPDFSILDIILNGHPVTAQIAQTLDPRVLKCGYCLVDWRGMIERLTRGLSK